VPAEIGISVVIAATHEWPFLKPCLDVLIPQCKEIGAEIWIADATGGAVAPAILSSTGKIHHLVIPGGSVFELRAKATERARGRIVAWTEDHCIPSADWCAKIQEAHDRHPQVALIGGAVTNGSCKAAMDWANFLCTFGPLIPPFQRPPLRRAPAVANLSIKRWALPAGPLRAGFIETVFEGRLLASGQVRFEDSVRVKHVQSWGFWGTIAAHYHNGRSTTGLLADTLPLWRRVRQIAVCFVMPFELLRTSVVPMLGKADVPWVRHLPLIFCLALAFSVGEGIGLIRRGAGSSPYHLE
jgi:hypothetical protein